jgi:hypothetical protein
MPAVLAATKEIMVQDANFGRLPFINSESDKENNANHQRRKHWGTNPLENASAKTECSQEQS